MIDPKRENANCSRPRSMVTRLKHPNQQRLVDLIVHLMHPKGFKHVMFVVFVVFVEVLDPSFRRSNDFV